jgi:hypothetical protein
VPGLRRMELSAEFMDLPYDEGRRVAVFNAETGSPSEAALRLLGAETHARGRAGY